jgi:hypothetical protein
MYCLYRIFATVRYGATTALLYVSNTHLTVNTSTSTYTTERDAREVSTSK